MFIPDPRINDTDKLAGLRAFAKDPAFQAKWHAVKQAKKAKLADLIKRVHGDDDINLNALFDIQVGLGLPGMWLLGHVWGGGSEMGVAG